MWDSPDLFCVVYRYHYLVGDITTCPVSQGLSVSSDFFAAAAHAKSTSTKPGNEEHSLSVCEERGTLSSHTGGN